ncbi:precorrin-2 dehydrogenase/sirohydrochlorin ferrochelatase family protein [Paenibacillus agricola]|uniref:precorrin-2 dehydrogenase n=1 Tax=Paenibacillus agricola TaxID=2716264 RepID=A0ABX0J5K1_9BACL|nr:bifunctional precorrin-2 dehydrogenase/sirohydrochlorin ferrochelatase [Paenibacillus agricola]NHN30118.1 bifunctional precorrin-2 dehydrogenase/sirohydrochlorin ferrochelatase [Paenibacillus agricola]
MTINSDSIAYYPLFANLTGKACAIVGGGAVAERKAASLLEAGALVTVISPACSAQMESWVQQGKLALVREGYRAGMSAVAQATLVFAATDSYEINESIRLEAESLGKLVTVADHTAGSGFIVPAVVRRGRLLIAVSTGGASPAVAKKIKQELEHTFGSEYEDYLDLLQELRLLIQSLVGNTVVRQHVFKLMLEWDLIGFIRLGHLKAAWKRELFDRVTQTPTLDGMVRIGLWIQGHLH